MQPQSCVILYQASWVQRVCGSPITTVTSQRILENDFKVEKLQCYFNSEASILC